LCCGAHKRSKYMFLNTYQIIINCYFWFLFFDTTISPNQQGKPNNYNLSTMFQCLRCAEGCDECIDSSPCIASLNWVLRTIILVLSLVIIGCLPLVVFFTWKYGHLKVNILITIKTKLITKMSLILNYTHSLFLH